MALDSVEVKAKNYEDERMMSLQRLRLADLEPNRTDLITFKVVNDDLIEIKPILKETSEFEERKTLLKKSLKSVSYVLNTLEGCTTIMKEINSIFDESEGINLFENCSKTNSKVMEDFYYDSNLIFYHLKYPLSVQLDDIYCLTRGINERIFSLKSLDCAISEQKHSCKQLQQLQNESIIAMDRAQGSLANLTSSSMAFDRKIAAKNAEIEKRIKKVEECSKDFESIYQYISTNLSKWERISDTFLIEEIKKLN